MKETLEAVYENGVLRPLKPIPWLSEHQRATVTVSADTSERTPPEFDALLGHWPEDERGDGFEQAFQIWKKAQTVRALPDE
ncbi:MAG: antitoxin family protein [Planctomycetes bacterium]|nr:antitoxin family protein [Planctomycetota bacterium]